MNLEWYISIQSSSLDVSKFMCKFFKLTSGSGQVIVNSNKKRVLDTQIENIPSLLIEGRKMQRWVSF